MDGFHNITSELFESLLRDFIGQGFHWSELAQLVTPDPFSSCELGGVRT